jgi:hypothetical protein
VDVKLESSHEMRETRAEQIAPWADEFNSPSLCALMPKAPKKKSFFHMVINRVNNTEADGGNGNAKH